VQVSFDIDKNGEPVNIRVEKSLCDNCDKEAIRLVREGPKWKHKRSGRQKATILVNFNPSAK
jgi:TonB family protein